VKDMIKPGMFISDRYEIIDKVGSGGMADVYKAKCHRLNRFVAIKILKQEYSDDTNFVNKFRGEAQSAAGLSHPNIVNVYDVGEEDGLYYIVMELVEGITLKNFIERKGKLDLKEAIGIAIQIAQGMEAAHTNHIIHRDIKPQNIIISREGKVKVTDFGIAKAASSNTITSNAMGSVHYISPEQARGGYSDEKSDIYSLGVTLYEMLSGMVPFVGDNTVSVALLHIQGEATPLRQLDPNIPISVDRIVQKCMQKKPERRYLTAGDLIADLKKAIMNPNGDFVKIAPTVIDDSPTINISEDEVNHIRNASKRVDAPMVDIDDDDEDIEDNEDEDDNDGDLDPKLEKLAVFSGIGLVIVLVIIILVLVGKASGFFKFSDSGKNNSSIEDVIESPANESALPSESPEAEIKVPEVVGYTLDEATAMLNDAGLSPRYTYEASDTIEKDYVISQSPEKDTIAAKNDEVALVISSGPETFQLPDVTNKSDNEAVTILTENNLNVKHDYAYSDTVDEGKVISTNPKPGSSVVEGDSVTITISNGKEVKTVYVPDLSNRSEDDAIEILKNSGLKVGNISYKNSDKVEEGLVIYQDYSVNQKVEEGTAISFTVSLGAEETSYSYRGSVTINDNPFMDEMEEGIITLELTQDGETNVVYEETLSYSSFPLNVPIEGSSTSKGTIKMYLNGELCPGSWVVSFTKVAD
jgi:serine/threonine-protein kinase